MNLKRIILFAFAGLSLAAFGQTRISANCQADINAIKAIYKLNSNEFYSNKYPVYKIGGVSYVNLLFKVGMGFKEADVQSFGAIVGGKSNRIVSVKWPITKLDFLDEFSHVEIIQVAQKLKPNLSKLRYDTRVDSVHAGLGLNSPFTGKNVLIGVTDWGFDYSSPMFYDTLLQNTRIVAAWDQFKSSGPNPNGFSYGTEFNNLADLIAAGSDTANIYSYSTHGTHVAGIAGGSGAGTVYRGVAFESQFLMATFLPDEAAVLDAWQWMFDRAEAEGKRLVVNMSWGLYHTGALDGTSLLSQALDNFSELGVVFVTSAGNNGDVNFHLKHDFSADTVRSRVNFYSGVNANLWGQSVHAWGEPNKQFETRIKVLGTSNQLLAESAWYGSSYTTNYVDDFIVVGSDSVFFNLAMDQFYPTNNRPQMRLRIKKQPANYRIVIECTSLSGTVHFWNVTELTTDVGNWGMPFTSLGVDYLSGDASYSIGAPACTQSAITVASHRAEYESFNGNIIGGGRSDFSSIGPLMTEEFKPDISAPGQGVASSISSYTDAGFNPLITVDFNGRVYPFASFSGTSMSSPAVAGIAALLLEANPDLSPHQVKQIIMQTARLDDETGAVGLLDNTKWGAGKVNAYKAIKKALNTVSTAEASNPTTWQVFPIPSSQFLYIKGLNQDVTSIQLIHLTGQVVLEYAPTSVIDVSKLTAGFYIVRVQKPSGYEQKMLIIE